MLVHGTGWRGASAVTVLLLSSVALLTNAIIGGRVIEVLPLLLVPAVAGYAVGGLASPPVAAMAAVGAAAALTQANQLASPVQVPVLDDLVFFLLLVGAPALAGATVRSRTVQARELRRLTELLGVKRGLELRAASLEERNRLEVDLDRYFSEQLGGIALRAEGARTVSGNELSKALVEIEDTARTTLDRLRHALGELRDGTGPAIDNEPAVPPIPAEDSPGPKDVILAAAVSIGISVEAVVSPDARGPTWANIVLATAVASPLAWRRSRPIAATAAMGASLVVMARWCTPPTTMVTTIAPLLVAAYAIGAYARRWSRVAGFVVLAAALSATVASSPTAVPDADGIMPALVMTGLAGALGIVTAGWSVRATRLRQALDALEAGRDAQVHLAVAEQRNTVARDLHDSVAHAMTVVCLQAAGGRVTGDRLTLDTIASIARRGLNELRQGLDILGDGISLDASSLATQARLAGLDPDIRVIGDPLCLPLSAVHLGSRVLREAIVNAGRYAPGARLTVSVNAQPRLMQLDVLDSGAAVDAPWGDGAGTGLSGLATDVARAGGTLEWGPVPNGGFRVYAEVPA